MYNVKDVQFVGKHDYDKEKCLTDAGWNKTFSIGIFKNFMIEILRLFKWGFL